MLSNTKTGHGRAAALLLGAVLVSGGGCADGEPPPTGGGAASPPARLQSVVLPTVADAKLADTSEQLARRFLVPDEVSVRYALGLARDKGHLGSDVRACARWQRVGQHDELLANEYLIGAGPDCERWSAVLAWARKGSHQQGELTELQRASVGRFFTVAVSPYSFRHPLYEAQGGVPAWVLRAAQTDAGAVPWRCEPRYVRSKLGPNDAELATYACPAGLVGFEHVGAKEVTTALPSAHIDALASFRAWQQAVTRQYPDDLAGRIERLERLWTRYPEAELP